MHPKDISKFDQAAQHIVDNLPPLLWNLFMSCQDQGFTEEQSMRIILKYTELIRETPED